MAKLCIPLNEIKTLYVDDNKTIKEIAKIFCVSPGTIYGRLKALGVNTSTGNKCKTRKSKITRVIVNCCNCGKEIMRTYKRSFRKNPVCSKECYSISKSIRSKGENNPFYGKHFEGKSLKKLSESCKKSSYVKGKKLPQEWRDKISKGRLVKYGRTEPKGIHDRTSIEYKNYLKNVFTRDMYTCQKCGKRGGTLNAHHLKNFSSNEKLRHTPVNGKTFCHKCHKIFHSIYGKENNTVQQYLEFVKRSDVV